MWLFGYDEDGTPLRPAQVRTRRAQRHLRVCGRGGLSLASHTCTSSFELSLIVTTTASAVVVTMISSCTGRQVFEDMSADHAKKTVLPTPTLLPPGPWPTPFSPTPLCDRITPLAIVSPIV